MWLPISWSVPLNSFACPGSLSMLVPSMKNVAFTLYFLSRASISSVYSPGPLSKVRARHLTGREVFSLTVTEIWVVIEVPGFEKVTRVLPGRRP